MVIFCDEYLHKRCVSANARRNTQETLVGAIVVGSPNRVRALIAIAGAWSEDEGDIEAQAEAEAHEGGDE